MTDEEIALLDQYPDVIKGFLIAVRAIDQTLKEKGITTKEPMTWKNCPCEGCQVFRSQVSQRSQKGGEAL